MKKLKSVIFLTLFLGTFFMANCKDSLQLVKYTPEFKFEDGIFLDFEQVKNNSPIEKARILTTVNFNDNDFFDEIIQNQKFSYYDNFGKRYDFPTKNIWGYADQGILYKKTGNYYFRITVVGAICHFVAYVTTYNVTPGSYYNPYTGYDNYGYVNSRVNERTDLKQFIFDFKTGNTVEFTPSNVEILLMDDPELHEEYASLRKKKRKQMKFIYIRKFNDRNPIYFPKKSL